MVRSTMYQLQMSYSKPITSNLASKLSKLTTSNSNSRCSMRTNSTSNKSSTMINSNISNITMKLNSNNLWKLTKIRKVRNNSRSTMLSKKCKRRQLNQLLRSNLKLLRMPNKNQIQLKKSNRNQSFRNSSLFTQIWINQEKPAFLMNHRS